MVKSLQTVLIPLSLVAIVVTSSVVVVVVIANTDGAQGLILAWTTNLFAAGRAPDRGTATRPRAAGNVGEDEDARGATSGLSETHRRTQGISLRQGGTL